MLEILYLNTSAFGYVLLRKCHHLGTQFVLICRLSDETEKVNISLSGTLFFFSRVIIYKINLYKFKLWMITTYIKLL